MPAESPSHSPERGGDLTHRTVSGLLWTGWGRVANAALQLGIVGVLARLLSPADFGVVSAALIVVGLSSIVSQIGLGPAIVQRRDLEPRHLDTAFTASVLLGILLGAVVWIVAPFVASVVRIPAAAPVLRALALTFPIQGLGLVSEALLRRDLAFRWLANRDVIAYAVGYGGVGVTLAVLGWGPWALVAGQLAQTALRTAMLLIAHPPRRRGAGEWLAFRELMYFGGGFTIARLANYAALQGDNVVVGYALGPSALGVYGRAYQLMAAPAHGIGLVLDSVLFPAMAKVQDDAARLATAYRRGVAIIALLVLPTSMLALVAAPEVIRVVLGPRWTAAVAPFQILALGMLFRTSYKMSDSLARSAGAVYRRAWRQILYALLVVAGGGIGQAWGIAGVAWGVLAAVTVNFAFMAHLSLSVARMSWASLWQAHVPPVLLTAATLPVVWIAAEGARYAALPAPFVLVAAGVAALGSAGALVWWSPTVFVGQDGLWIVERLRRFLPPRLAFASRTASGSAGLR
jgi:O-antigen/teichoic acid export membrane protein